MGLFTKNWQCIFFKLWKKNLILKFIYGINSDFLQYIHPCVIIARPSVINFNPNWIRLTLPV